MSSLRDSIVLVENIVELFNCNNKKLSYGRRTARCVMSVKILPTATQYCKTTCTSPDKIDVMKLEV